MEEINGFNGAILKSDPRDYKLGSLGIEVPKSFNSDTFQYNQLEYSDEFGNNLCTLYFAIGMISDLIGRELTTDERKTLANIRVSMEDFNKDKGGYLVEGTNCVRRWWNENNPTNQIRQFQIETLEEIKDALSKGHRVGFGFRGNRDYNNDASDGTLDSIEIGDTTYGHATTLKLIDSEVVVDSYEGLKKFNTYKIKDFNAFINHTNTFPKLYLYLFSNDAIDAEIYLMKEKYKDLYPNIKFNEEKIKELRAKLSNKNPL